MHLAGREHEIIRNVLLHHEPHALNVVTRVSPVALRVDVAEVKAVLPVRVKEDCESKQYMSKEGINVV